MSSLSLYNKWRPRSFADPDDHPLIGQEHVTRTLRNAVASNTMAHAYLFCGPRGTGKTSAARILARAVNCRRGQRGEPCNECENCLALLSGRQLDLLIEIDGASNRGVDDVRQLRERIMQRPGGADLTGRFKVYIIDEVHMLTGEAFNALLKSLEEPPPHVIFVLATTDPQKVPATVASRCQRFDFKPVPLELLVKHLDHVATSEGVRVEPEGMELLARNAAGGVRDAVSLLDQALAYAGTGRTPDALDAGGVEGTTARAGSVSARQIQAMLGLTDSAAVNQLVDAVLGGDLPGAIRVIHTVSAQGSDLRQFARQVLEFLRALLLTASGTGSLLQLDEDTQDAVQQRSGRVSLSELVRLIKLVSQAEQGLKSPAAQPQLPLELAVVEAVLRPGEGVSDGAIPRPQAASRAPVPVTQVSSTRPQLIAPARPVQSEPPSEQRVPAAGPARENAVAFAPAPDSGRAPRPRVEPSQAGPVQDVEAAQPVDDTAAPEPDRSLPVARAATPGEAEMSAPDVSPTEVSPADEGSPEPRPGSTRVGTAPAAATVITLELVQERWTAVLRAVRQASRSVEALLRDATPIGVEEGNVVVLQFRYSIHCNKVNEPANLIAARRALSRTLGVECKLRCVTAEGGGPKGDRPRGQAGMSDPVVVKAMRIWRAQILTPAELAAVEAVPIAGAFPGKDSWQAREPLHLALGGTPGSDV